MEDIGNIKEKALKQHVPIIMDDSLNAVIKILKEIKPLRILEIGTAVGYSSIRFSEYLQNDGRIDTIERNLDMIAEAKANIKLLHLENRINILEGDAVEILPTLNEKYDIIFIDAAKGKYPIFLEQALRLKTPRGIIIADNILYKGYTLSDYNKHKQRTAVRGLREYLKMLEENKELITTILEVGDGLAISKPKVEE